MPRNDRRPGTPGPQTRQNLNPLPVQPLATPPLVAEVPRLNIGSSAPAQTRKHPANTALEGRFPRDGSALKQPHSPLSAAHRNHALLAIEPPSSPVQYAQLPLLDATIDGELRSLLPQAVLRDLHNLCIRQTMEKISQMRKASRAGNLRAVAAGAHAISGSAAMLGAVRLAAFARQLHSRCVPVAPDAHHTAIQHTAVEISLAELTLCCRQLARALSSPELTQ